MEGSPSGAVTLFDGMWPRKQIDIACRDVAWGIVQVFRPGVHPEQAGIVPAAWIAPGEALVSLSVRTGWDLLLGVLALPAGSEVALSAITVPDMARIVRHHGLVPVPVAVDPETLAPGAADVERVLTPKTRVILIAHLFGTRVDMSPIVALARDRGLLVVEDCAQAYDGPRYRGDDGSDVCLFSFGPIKTATALGGAVLRVRDPALRERMLRRQATYPVQSRWAYLRRLLKYALACAVMTRFAYGALIRCCQAAGVDFDRRFARLSHSFPADRLFGLIRHRPCAPLLAMLSRRLADQATTARLERRTGRGWRFARALANGSVVGRENATHTFWVLPVRLADRESAVARLRSAGFDATHRSSMSVVLPADAASTGGGEHDWLDEVVFLPNGEALPDHALEHMASVLESSGVDLAMQPPMAAVEAS